MFTRQGQEHAPASGVQRNPPAAPVRYEPTLGGYALAPLAEARELALANRQLAQSGGDPLAAKRRSPSLPTFAETAENVTTTHRKAWKAETSSVPMWRATLRDYAHRRQVRRSGDDRRRGRRAAADLDTEASDGAEGASAHRHGHEVAHRAGRPGEQSGRRRHRGSAAETQCAGTASAGASPWRGLRGSCRCALVVGMDRDEAGRPIWSTT